MNDWIELHSRGRAFAGFVLFAARGKMRVVLGFRAWLHRRYLIRTTVPKTRCMPPNPRPSHSAAISGSSHAHKPSAIKMAPSERMKIGAKKLTLQNPQP